MLTEVRNFAKFLLRPVTPGMIPNQANKENE